MAEFEAGREIISLGTTNNIFYIIAETKRKVNMVFILFPRGPERKQQSVTAS